MRKPIGNGLVEITGENKVMDNAWFCMDLMEFLRGSDWDTFHFSFQQAKSGNCPFKNICERYKRTILKPGRQLTLF